MQLDLFVHPGFAGSVGLAQDINYRAYVHALCNVAKKSENAIHILDPRCGIQDSFLDTFIPSGRKVFSYAVDRYCSGAIRSEDLERYDQIVGKLRHEDEVRVHGAYYGFCTLDAALHTYWIAVRGERRVPSFSTTLFENRRHPLLLDGENIEDFEDFLEAISSQIKFGIVYEREESTFSSTRQRFVDAMKDEKTIVYRAVSH